MTDTAVVPWDRMKSLQNNLNSFENVIYDQGWISLEGNHWEEGKNFLNKLHWENWLAIWNKGCSVITSHFLSKILNDKVSKCFWKFS